MTRRLVVVSARIGPQKTPRHAFAAFTRKEQQNHKHLPTSHSVGWSAIVSVCWKTHWTLVKPCFVLVLCSRAFFVFRVCGRPSQLESVPRSGCGMTSHSLRVVSPSILRKVWPACPSLPLRRACEIKIKMPHFFQGVSDGLFRRGSLRGDHQDAL